MNKPNKSKKKRNNFKISCLVNDAKFPSEL